MGVNPEDLTLRELFYMVDGRAMSNYAVFSYLASVVVNVLCKDADVSPKDLNPYKSPYDESETEKNLPSGVDFLVEHAAEMGIEIVNKSVDDL